MRPTDSLLLGNNEFSYKSYKDMPKMVSEDLELSLDAHLVLIGVNNTVLQQEKIILRVTNHRLVFEYTGPSVGEVSCQGKSADYVPFWYMNGVDTHALSKGKTLLQFTLKDFSSFSLQLPTMAEAKSITSFIKAKTSQKLSSSNITLLLKDTHKAYFYSAQAELASHNWPVPCPWKVWDCSSSANSPYQGCCILWSGWSAKDIADLTQKRVDGCILTYSWGYGDPKSPFHGNSLLRCSRLTEGTKVPLKDLQMLEEIFMDMNSDYLSPEGEKKILILDVGTSGKSHPQQYEDVCRFSSLVQKQELVRSHLSSFLGTISRCWNNFKSINEVLENNSWKKVLVSTLDTAKTFAKHLQKTTLIVQRESGTSGDIDTIIVCLIQLMLDKQYRTIEGFFRLVEKEWFIFGNGTIPLYSTFFLFANCVVNMIDNCPALFEFNQVLLANFLDAFIELEYLIGAKDIKPGYVQSFVLAKPGGKNMFFVPQDVDISAWNPSPSVWLQHALKRNPFVMKKIMDLNSSLEKEKADRTILIMTKNLYWMPPVWDMTKAGSFTLTNGFLANLDVSFACITGLKKLTLDHNRFSQIPASIALMTNLKSLSLRYNFLGKETRAMNKLPASIKSLDLESNELEDISSIILSCPSITSLTISSNKLSRLPACFAVWKDLTVLKLRGNQLKCLPSRALPVSLRYLDVGENPISYIAPSIRHLTNLHSFVLDNTEMKQLPREITNLVSLTFLDVSHNDFKSFPERFQSLTKLQHLAISNNKFTSLDTLMNIPSLAVINARANRITSLSRFVGNLVNLRTLDLANNKLNFVSMAICTLELLQKLDLSCNLLTFLPLPLERMNLEVLKVNGNPLPLPPELADAGTDQILRHLSSVQVTNLSRSRSKLTVIGDVRAGKSKLIGHLAKKWQPLAPRVRRFTVQNGEGISESESESEEEEEGEREMASHHDAESCSATSGHESDSGEDDGGKDSASNAQEDYRVVVRRCTFERSKDGNVTPRRIGTSLKAINKKPRKLKVAVNIWDFDNLPSDIYLSTHHLFLSQGSVFLLVFRLTDPFTSITFWLQSLVEHLKNPLVYLVGTHSDILPIGSVESIHSVISDIILPFKPLTEDIRMFFVSNETEEHIYSLRQNLEEELAKKSQLPPETKQNSYHLFESYLQECQISQVEIIPPKDLARLSSICGFSSSKEKQVCLSSLHEVGEVLYLGKGSEEMIVLQPTWLLKIISSLFRQGKLNSYRGVLTHTQLASMWGGYSSYLYNILLRLLAQVGIAYSVEVDEESYKKLLRNASDKKLALPSGTPSDAPPTDAPSHLIGISLIPFLLPEERPRESIKKLWPSELPPGTLEFHRVFKLNFTPLALFAQLSVRFLETTGLPRCIWKGGIICSYNNQTIFLEQTNNTISCCIQTTDPDGFFSIFEMIELNLAEFGGLEWECFVSLPPEKTELKKISELLALRSTRSTIVYKGGEIKIDDLIPDLTFSKFTGVRLDYSEIKILKPLDKGGFSKVYKGLISLNGRNRSVAVKELIFTTIVTRTERLKSFQEFRHEVLIHSQLRHTNICQLIAICNKPQCLLLELLEGGSLGDLVISHTATLSWQQRLLIARDVGKGLRYMHECKPPIVHLDMKCQNVMLVSTDPLDMVCKIVDFGTSRVVTTPFLTEPCPVFNPTYLAPELLKSEPYNCAVDIYAFGIMLYELVKRQQYFYRVNWLSDIADKVLAGTRPKLPKWSIPEYTDLVTKCWSQSADIQNRTSSISLRSELVCRYSEQNFIHLTSFRASLQMRVQIGILFISFFTFSLFHFFTSSLLHFSVFTFSLFPFFSLFSHTSPISLHSEPVCRCAPRLEFYHGIHRYHDLRKL
eukprot:TRINITY_DN3172_c0_g1_i15.p1 TRINITY_DN3172_c0_g1~~TRINITY_DN3172_c0_g1_i15.p1  ORF type:complete len:1850 (+),score=271.92 TRINITY_DN3172_c0_g1_i15:16-5565(+)